MKRTLILATCLAALGAGAFAATKITPPKGAASIVLPGDAGMTFKAGPGQQAAQTYCLTCHSSAYVSTQPVLSKAAWTAEVTKMRNVFGAQIPEDQVPGIVEYLTAQYGKP